MANDPTLIQDLRHRLQEASILCEDMAIERLAAYIGLLKEWNSVHNLTGAKSTPSMIDQIVDSLFITTFLPRKPETLLDIGTGAGFPGLILAIAWPKTKTTLCEPLQKRAAFLRYVATNLHLENVTVANEKVQSLPPRPFTLITSRAVTETATLLSWCRPFIGSDTQLLFYKGAQVLEEIQPLQECDYSIVRRHKRHYLWIKEGKEC